MQFALALMRNHAKIEGNMLTTCEQARQKDISVPIFHTLNTFVWSSSEERLSKLLKFKIRSSAELAWLRYFTTVSLSLSNCSHLFIVTYKNKQTNKSRTGMQRQKDQRGETKNFFVSYWRRKKRERPDIK